jgi:histidine ammonia-lyase
MIEINGEALTIEQVVAVARQGERVAPLSKDALQQMQASQSWVDQMVLQDSVPLYGINTGFGPLATRRIQPEETATLSRNVILACVTGVGEPLSVEVVRAMMLIRANSLASGFSGVRPALVQTLIDMLNAKVTPYVPEKGSLGASGDLAPLAHIAVVMTRDASEGDGGYSGQAWLDGNLMTGSEAMERAGIPRLVAQAKEGLTLTNGTTFMAAVGALCVNDAQCLLRHAEIAAALSLEALLGLTSAFHPLLNQANRQPGQIRTAANLLALLQDSRLVDTQPERVQDAYSLRCIPQVIGPAQDMLDFLHQRLSDALNAATDNPLIFLRPEIRLVSGGNFHGQGLAMWLDVLGIALSGVANQVERRIFRLLTPELSFGLPSMLAPVPGLDSGLMMPQYTAAALVSDNKTLAHPDSVDSIPSSANQEDHVSMGANAARHTLEIIENVRNIIAIELLCSAQGVDLRPDGPARLGRGTRIAYQLIREHVPFLQHDRALTPDIQVLNQIVNSNRILEAVQKVLGDEIDYSNV